MATKIPYLSWLLSYHTYSHVQKKCSMLGRASNTINTQAIIMISRREYTPNQSEWYSSSTSTKIQANIQHIFTTKIIENILPTASLITNRLIRNSRLRIWRECLWHIHKKLQLHIGRGCFGHDVRNNFNSITIQP